MDPSLGITMDKLRQEMEETPLERETRTAGHFAEIEEALPHAMTSRADIPLLDNLSSYLGTHNPLARPATAAENAVWLLDNTAYHPTHHHLHPHEQDAAYPPPWQAEYVAAYFKRSSGKNASGIVADIADKIGLGAKGESKEEGEKTIATRLQPFLQTIQPARSVDVKLPGGEVKRLGPGGREAISSQIVHGLGELKDGETMQVEAVEKAVAPHGSMNTYVAGPEGWMVVSDIDDSIKITLTPSPVGILTSTFVSTPTPITGMPALYAHIHTTLSPTWFYLSASPYNLYPFLRSFLHTYYHPGPIVLRDASWQDLGGFLASLTQGTEAYKASRMEKMYGWLPGRKVLCVGDSTQSDPEAYGELYRRHPDWIKKIFIRKVTDVAEMDETEKNQPQRFEKAFRDVPKDVWQVFTEPGELYGAINTLKGLLGT